jgi:hypothetical protein
MFAAVFGPDLVVAVLFLFIPLAFLALSIIAIVDVSSHSKVDFYAAGYSKIAWIVIIGVLTLFYGFGCLNAAYYLIAVRPKILRVEAARKADAYASHLDVESPLGFCSACGASIAGNGKYCSNCGVTTSN